MSNEWHISSLVVHGRPDWLKGITAAVEALEGVEIHGTDDKGKIVVTVEAPDEAGIVDRIDRINRIDGILSTVLVYHHSEDADALEEQIDDETDSARVH